MTKYEALSIIISCIAVLGTLYVWSGQRKLQREANDLQRATQALAKKQLELIKRDEINRSKARLTLSLEREGPSTFTFYISNTRDVEARDVEMRLVLDDETHNPIIPQEYTAKFPVKKLSAGASVSLEAVRTLGSPSAYNAILKWIDPDGPHREEEAYVTV